jgi:hypothetical protein
MGVGRADENGIGLSLVDNVVGVLTIASQETLIFAAQNRFADKACCGCIHVRASFD